jgi:hypothetical protein
MNVQHRIKKQKSSTDELVKSQKINLLSFRPGSESGMTAKPESSHFNSFWTPAFAGVTGLGLFTKPSVLNIQYLFSFQPF